MKPPLLLLAGTSEAGKSTAGGYLATHGVHRVKIRTILTRLTTGIRVEHEGVPMREGFDAREFLDQVLRLPLPEGCRAAAIESFIDAELAAATKRTWPGLCRIVFITASRANRLHRLTITREPSADQAAAILDGKDARKRVNEQWRRWRDITDHWIDNNGTRADYLASLDHILGDLTIDNREG